MRKGDENFNETFIVLKISFKHERKVLKNITIRNERDDKGLNIFIINFVD